MEQILVRIDDKLSRISRGSGLVGDDEDVIQDLIGYLILLQIAIDRRDEQVFWEASESSTTDDCRDEQRPLRGM